MLDQQLSPEVIEFLQATGHARGVTDPAQIKTFEDGGYVMAYRLLFHWTVISGNLADIWSYDNRWCFETRELALAAVADWPSEAWEAHEPSGWHRHPPTARRRPGGDPAREYVEG